MVTTGTPVDDETSIEIRSSQCILPSSASTGKTVLPGPCAALVSAVTGASSLSVRVGTKIGGLWIAGARETTLTGLELSRAAVEAILTSAGRDVSNRRRDELGRVEAENMLERSVCFDCPSPCILTNAHGV